MAEQRDEHLTSEELDAIEARARAATQGDWTERGMHPYRVENSTVIVEDDKPIERHVVKVVSRDSGGNIVHRFIANLVPAATRMRWRPTPRISPASIRRQRCAWSRWRGGTPIPPWMRTSGCCAPTSWPSGFSSDTSKARPLEAVSFGAMREKLRAALDEASHDPR